MSKNLINDATNLTGEEKDLIIENIKEHVEHGREINQFVFRAPPRGTPGKLLISVEYQSPGLAAPAWAHYDAMKILQRARLIQHWDTY